MGLGLLFRIGFELCQRLSHLSFGCRMFPCVSLELFPQFPQRLGAGFCFVFGIGSGLCLSPARCLGSFLVVGQSRQSLIGIRYSGGL